MLAAMATAAERLETYARLTVQVGLNLQPGQVLGVSALIEHAPLARAIAREAYRAGARYVDVLYSDQHVRRSHIELASEAELGHSPPWLVHRFRALGEIGGAVCAITGNPEPELFADLDGERVGNSRMREVAEATLALTDGLCNWTIVAYPNEGWAQTVFGEPDVERLWEAVGQAVRLDQPDPVAAWKEHIERLQHRAAALNERRFDELRYRGPGTDLTIGLHPDSEWQAALDESQGIKHVANMPTEEVFTTPDARRAEGTVRSTLPLQIQGNIVRDLEVRFEGGRALLQARDVVAPRGDGIGLVEAHRLADRVPEALDVRLPEDRLRPALVRVGDDRPVAEAVGQRERRLGDLAHACLADALAVEVGVELRLRVAGDRTQRASGLAEVAQPLHEPGR